VKIKKLDPRGRPAIFVGYAETSKAYKVLGAEPRKMVVSRDVTFGIGDIIQTEIPIGGDSGSMTPTEKPPAQCEGREAGSESEIIEARIEAACSNQGVSPSESDDGDDPTVNKQPSSE